MSERPETVPEGEGPTTTQETVAYRCAGCGEFLDGEDAAAGFHIVPVYDSEGYPVPSQCGPVEMVAAPVGEIERLMGDIEAFIVIADRDTDACNAAKKAVAALRSELQNAKTDHALLCEDYKCLVESLEMKREALAQAMSALEPFAKQCEAILSDYEGSCYSVIAPKVTVWQGKDAIETLKKLGGTDGA